MGFFVSSSANQETCGLSGCIELPDRAGRSGAVAAITSGIGATLFGAAVAIRGARGPVPTAGATVAR